MPRVFFQVRGQSSILHPRRDQREAREYSFIGTQEMENVRMAQPAPWKDLPKESL